MLRFDDVHKFKFVYKIITFLSFLYYAMLFGYEFEAILVKYLHSNINLYFRMSFYDYIHCFL